MVTCSFKRRTASRQAEHRKEEEERDIDIGEDDTVPSSRIADAEIEYTGQGDISDTQRRGWLARIMSKIWPF